MQVILTPLSEQGGTGSLCAVQCKGSATPLPSLNPYGAAAEIFLGG